MSVLRKIGQFFKGAIRKVGDIGGKVLSGVGAVKGVLDSTGITSALTGALASNPLTMPFAAGLAAANPVIDAGKGLMGAMRKVG